MSDLKPKRTLLESQIEVECVRSRESGPESFMVGAGGVDLTVIEHIEELLQEIELSQVRSHSPENIDGDFTSVFKKISEIEKKMKKFEEESAALKKLLMRLN